jgi:hypothetical protein
MLREAFGEHSLSPTAVINGSRVQVEDNGRSGRTVTSKTTENVGNVPRVCRRRWDQLWRLAGDVTRTCEHASHWREVCPRLLTDDQSL